jgi:hypothetical protein
MIRFIKTKSVPSPKGLLDIYLTVKGGHIKRGRLYPSLALFNHAAYEKLQVKAVCKK